MPTSARRCDGRMFLCRGGVEMIIMYRWSQDGIRLEWPHKAAFREEGILLDVQGSGGVDR